MSPPARGLALVVLLASCWPLAQTMPSGGFGAGPDALQGLKSMFTSAFSRVPVPSVGTAEILGDAVQWGSKIKYVGALGAALGGAELLNYGLRAAMASVATQAFGADFAACANYSNSISAPAPASLNALQCGSKIQSTVARAIPGRYPNPGETVYWWSSDYHYYRVYGTGGDKYNANSSGCRTSSQLYSVTAPEISSDFALFNISCESVNTTSPVYYPEYVSGSEGVPAHPGLPAQLESAIRSTLSGLQPFAVPGTDLLHPFPGMTLRPTPNENQLAGEPVNRLVDTDLDGTSDYLELNPPAGVAATDPNNAASHPLVLTPAEQAAAAAAAAAAATAATAAATEAAVQASSQACTAAGRVWNQTTSSCAPTAELCPAGQTRIDGACKPSEQADPGNVCGDFAPARFLAHPVSYLKDLLLPCESWGDLIAPVLSGIRDKFPFSLAASLNGWFDAAGSAGGGPTAMPTALGPIPLDWGWLASLWALIKTLVGVALWAWFVYWLIDRFTPRTEI